jgi:hypothetical protein
MKYWVLHILLVGVIVSVWLFSYNGYFDTPQPKQTMQIETIDTMVYEVPIVRDVFDTIYIEPIRMMLMVRPDTIDTLDIQPQSIVMEPDPITITQKMIDTIYDTVYVKVPIHQPNDTTIQQSFILNNIELLVTLIGGFFNMLLGFFQLKERNKQK